MPEMRWVTVHAGPVWQVDLLAGMLADEGIETFRPDFTTKTVDPFITGANPLLARLQVPEGDAERARALLEVLRARASAAEEGEDDGETPGRGGH